MHNHLIMNRFSDDTREHVLNILFRLMIDRSLTGDAVISSELERTVTSTLESCLENVENIVRITIYIEEL